MKALFIGGTGTISTEISKRCVALGWELTLLNRGNAKQRAPEGARLIQADVHDEDAVRRALGNERFDVAAEFVAYTPQEVERDIRLLEGRVGQYLFISSASAYQKPLSMPLITESTPLCNPYWEYSRNKAACEETLMRAYRERDFPVTIVRPSHTYCQRSVPVALHGAKGSYQVLCRMRQGKKIIIPGDGLTLWTVTHSRDFAVAFEGLMGNPQALGECFHITGDERLTWNQITPTSRARPWAWSPSCATSPAKPWRFSTPSGAAPFWAIKATTLCLTTKSCAAPCRAFAPKRALTAA